MALVMMLERNGQKERIPLAVRDARRGFALFALPRKRRHVPFLDEPEALAAIETLLERSA